LGKSGEETGVFSVRLLSLAVTAMVLAGCSSGLPNLLGGRDPAPSAQPQIATNNELALPPDLSLAAPGTRAAPANSALTADEGVYDDAAPTTPVKRVATAPTQDVYEQYGISKLNPDGTKKDEGKLREELRQAVLAKKRQQNPNHGTIFNVGELFRE
jgi:uncharacterized lipoprotein